MDDPLRALERLAEAGSCFVNIGFDLGSQVAIEDANRRQVLTCQRGLLNGLRHCEISESGTTVLAFTARSGINAGLGFDVYEQPNGWLVGIVARQATLSLFWDSWKIFDSRGDHLATVREDSVWKYILRKFLLGPFIPMSHIVVNNEGVQFAVIRELIGVFERRHKLQVHAPEQGQTDFRLLLAVTLILAVVQGRSERKSGI